MADLGRSGLRKSVLGGICELQGRDKTDMLPGCCCRAHCGQQQQHNIPVDRGRWHSAAPLRSGSIVLPKPSVGLSCMAWRCRKTARLSRRRTKEAAPLGFRRKIMLVGRKWPCCSSAGQTLDPRVRVKRLNSQNLGPTHLLAALCNDLPPCCLDYNSTHWTGQRTGYNSTHWPPPPLLLHRLQS